MVATTQHLALPTASSYEEQKYQTWLCERQMPATFQILGFVAFSIFGFALWDWWLSPTSIALTWPIRLLSLSLVAVCVLLLRFTGVASHWRVLSFISSCTLFALLLIILMRLPDGSLMGSGGLLLSAFLFRVHSARLAMAAAFFNALALVSVYHVFGVDSRIIINSEIFLIIASVGNITLNAADDRGDRQKFAMEGQLQRMATTDGLTGASNRRHFSGELTEEVERSHRYGYPLTLILLDIDRFKSVNDTRGHGDGDEALRVLAALGIDSGRGSDTFARLGGEEFVMLLPHTDLDAALALAERFRQRVEKQPIKGDSGQFFVTASFGVSALHRAESGDALVARADTCLYLAKNSGRNRVVGERELPPGHAKPVPVSSSPQSAASSASFTSSVRA